MTNVNITVTQSVVTVDNEQNVNVATIGIQGPPGSPGIMELTTVGSSGAATLSGGVLNIPIYTGGGGGSSVPAFRSVTSNTNMTLADYTVEANTTSGNLTINLPDSTTAYSAANGEGQIFNVAKPIAAHTVTIGSVNASDRINGNATMTLIMQANLSVQAGPNNTYTIL